MFSRIKPLNTQEFQEVLNGFTESYNQVIGFYHKNTIDKCKIWIGDILKLFPMNLLNEENLEKIINDIISDSDIYSFVFDLHYRFFSSINTGELVFKDRLILNIINGINVCNRDNNILPKTLLNTLTIQKSKDIPIKHFLNNNSFLLIIFLILLTKSK